MKETLRVYTREGRSPIRVQLSGISYCDGSYHICRKNSATTVIEYIVKGHGYVTRNGEDVPVYADSVYLLAQGEEQNYYSSGEDPWEKIFINVGGVLPPLLIEEYGLKGKWLFDGKGMKELFLRVAEISERKEKQDYEEAEVAAIFLEMLARLSKNNEQKEHSREALMIKEYIDSNSHRIISNKELAERIYRSQDFCVKLFYKEFETTPYNYQLTSKINIAKRLLRDTTLSVGEISARVGYNDNCYFSALFKEKASVSPREYRKKHSYSPKI